MGDDNLMAALKSHNPFFTVFLGNAWALKKGQRDAVCELWGRPPAWELRLVIGAVALTEICHDSETVLDIQECWAERLLERGWT